MSALFGGASKPKKEVVRETEPVKKDDREVQEARAAELARRRQAKGRQSTILAGRLLEPAPSGMKTLLGQ